MTLLDASVVKANHLATGTATTEGHRLLPLRRAPRVARERPGPFTVCNGRLCRRHATLWAYDFDNERIRILGPTSTHVRAGQEAPTHEIGFCPGCGCAHPQASC
jgi:hypothetical protein